MPRKGLYSYEAIFDVLKELPIFYENGEMKRPKDPIWKTVVSRLPGMNIHNMYIFVRQDRKNVRTNLYKYLNIECTPEVKLSKAKKKEPTKNSTSKWDDFLFYDQLDVRKQNKDDLEELISMKNDGCRKIIHKFGIVPFTVIYFHPKQVDLWNDLINVKSTVSLVVLNHLVDNASGKVTSDNIYLYALAVKIPNSVIFIAQMISDSTDTPEIQNFLNCWLQNKAVAPTEIVIPYSQTLLDAASLTFNFCTFDEYISRCYQYIMKTAETLPPTLISIDIFGIVKIVDSWSSFENILQIVKDFYLCSIMYLSTVDNLDEFSKAVVSILTLCQCPFQSTETLSRKDSLWNLLTSNTIERINQQYINYVTTNGSKSFSFLNLKQNLPPSSSTDELYDFINQLKQEAYELCDFSMDSEKPPNDYYCPILLEDLIQLLVKFPAWTRIVVKKAENSGMVSFCSTKHLENLKELKKPMKPSIFLEYHLKKLQTSTRLARNYVRTCQASEKYVVKEFRNNHTYLTQQTSLELQQDKRIEINIGGEPVEEMITESIEGIEMGEFCDSKVFDAEDFHGDEEIHAAHSSNDHFEEFDPNQSSNLVEKQEYLSHSEEMYSNGLSLESFKAKIYSTINSLLEFDDFVDNVLRMQINSGQEMDVCKVFLDCCKEMVTYEKFLGEMGRRLCTSDEAFVSSFEQLFRDCYHTLESFEKHELRNMSEFYGHLLSLDCISWEILSIVKLNEKEATTAKRNFIRALLQNILAQIGAVRLCQKLKEKKNEPAFQGLFPDNSKDALFAGNFFKLSGLKDLGNEVSLSTLNQKDVKVNDSATVNGLVGTKVVYLKACNLNFKKV